MGCKSYYELKLSDFKKRALEHAIQTTQEISKEHYRAEILLERSEGKSINKISKEKGFTKKTVKRIIRKYKKNGLASLSDEARNRKDRNAKKNDI